MLDTFIWTHWEDFINWFEGLGLIQQTIFTVLLVSLAVSITVLVCIGLFYLVKYIFLGIYYLFKGIFKGIYLLFKKLFHIIHINHICFFMYGKETKRYHEISIFIISTS